ncbi:YybH family protein [Rhodoglobus aureus]|uniref:Nuclear transport factor 2 family protein n=1 Tax=Rhodoglobus aureus TaxID=191497 RepID=A0ABN1VSV4_9MICO
MSSRTPHENDVLSAASAIVDAFKSTDGERYFRGFAPDATFIFHTEPARLSDRAEYERLWASWVDSGWKVLDCESSDASVQSFPGGAVFSHSVFTRVNTGESEESYRERETIVFRVDNDQLLAVHEHLSPMPDPAH